MSRKDTHHPGCASLTFTLEGDTEMYRKPTTVLPIALLLGAVSAAPVLAQTSSDYLAQPHRQFSESPVTFRSGGYDSFGIRPAQDRLPGEVPALPFTQDPASPKG
jgi:hypothetical protein